MDEIDVKYTDEAQDKTKEDCCPGNPFITFLVTPSISMQFINSSPLSGLFTRSLPISDGDTFERVKIKLSKDVKALKGIINKLLDNFSI